MEARNWYAWINLMPPKPDDFHVNGEVFAGNPGIQAELCIREPQGFNPNILLLDLHLVPRPGMWPQVMTWIPCRYDRVLTQHNPKYYEVEIFHNGISIARLKVDEIHLESLTKNDSGKNLVSQS